MKDDFLIDGERLLSELLELAKITDAEPVTYGTAVTRVVFSEWDMQARAWLKRLALEEGFAVREDAVGNTFMRMDGAEPQLPAVATGSHTDAIPHAGMFDGTVGVLGGLAAMRGLKRAAMRDPDARLKRSVELVMFTSEEPTRFGIGCLGSRLMSGVLDPVKADGLRDKDGSTLAEVRASAGFAGDLVSARLPEGHYSAWVELHIEQGPLLERGGAGIGIVTDIAAPAGYRFTIEGFGGHAGALLMPDRRDALCAAAEVILAVERCALATGAIDTVATVGTCGVYPGAVNSVPSRVVLELDIRDTDPERRDRVMREVRSSNVEIEARRGVRMREEMVNADLPARSSDEILKTIEEACRERGVRSQRMVSRAYHDSLFMARISPMAMIFIACRGGISHRPDEFAEVRDIVRGAEVLASTLARLASR